MILRERCPIRRTWTLTLVAALAFPTYGKQPQNEEHAPIYRAERVTHPNGYRELVFGNPMPSEWECLTNFDGTWCFYSPYPPVQEYTFDQAWAIGGLPMVPPREIPAPQTIWDMMWGLR